MKLPSNEGAFLAPMARITDVAFRSLCVKYGASMTVTELVSAKGLLQTQNKSKMLTIRAPNEKEFAIQLFGKEPKIMADAASLVSPDTKYIDINLGCPVPKVVRHGMGSALLAKPEHIAKIISKMTNQVNNPITAKIRIGLSKKTENAVQVAKAIEDAGASILTIHGRTTDQAYAGSADWNVIKKVKEKVNIPIVGNGDITTAQTAARRIAENNIDYVAVGRAASGNPLLFKQIKEQFANKPLSEITMENKFKVFEEYIKLSEKYEVSFLHQILQAQHFTKGLGNARRTRVLIGETKNTQDLVEAVKTILK